MCSKNNSRRDAFIRHHVIRLIMSENRKMPYNAEKAENARTNL